MSTRSKTRAAKVLDTKMASPPLSKSQKGKEPASKNKSDTNRTSKENIRTKSTKAGGKGKKRGTRRVSKSTNCTCTRGDDGSPMIYCAECRTWYHFICVDISEPDAEEINIYICPSCTETTGRRTAMIWEGEEAVEECDPTESPQSSKLVAVKSEPPQSSPESEENEDSEEDISSEDEYIAEDSRRNGKGNAHQNPGISHFEPEATSSRRARSKSTASPGPSSRLKRKNTNASEQHLPKKSKPDNSAADDPVRKYCLGKLEELFRDVFLRYPHVRVVQDEGAPGQIVSKKLEDLDDAEKEALLGEARQFAKDLEQCVYDIYSEPDKQGIPHAGGNYKDRFRMLQFNLSKPDRVVIHQRITCGSISPKEISLMSSTDLADEETKQSIRIAEQEALEHSILLKSTAPRAKITHKGLQDIENINGDVVSARELERQREHEQEAEERRETERLARLRAVQRQRTASISVPPESPTIPTSVNESWGAPPPVPVHAMSVDSPTSEISPTRTSMHPLYAPGTSDVTHEPELNLADLINIDEETITIQPTASSSELSPRPTDQPTETDGSSRDKLQTNPSPISQSTTGISPFAAKADRQRSLSFDLNSLWNAPRDESSTTPTSPVLLSPTSTLVSSSVHTVHKDDDSEKKGANIEPEHMEEANDQDFDMFLEEKEQEQIALSPDAIQASFDATPHVWDGKIYMPLDSSIPQETPVVARQMGGRSLDHNSLLWKTLFPSDVLRIDGRVPVENSNKFLLQMRMNASKELIGVAFSPASESCEDSFKLLCEFLIAKNRHGLVFPWGNRPKDHWPGRELYMIPLVSTEPLPEYMELLDDLKLPAIRKVNYLIGIWVLNKGKLAPPPAHLVQTATHALAPPPASQSPTVPNPPQALPGNPDASAALVAEVASLTPEQIQNVLRTLASTTALNIPTIPQPNHSQALPIHPHIPPQPVPSHQPPWPNQAPVGFYPPQGPQHHNPGPHDRDREFGRQSRPSQSNDRQGYGRNDRGWRGGRGRGRGRGRDDEFGQSIDSGWPRRPRNEQGGQGSASPARRW